MASLTEDFPILQERIKYLLTKDAKCMMYRDNDEKLVARIWSEEMGGEERVKRIDAYQFFRKYAMDEITPADAITRSRRKVQEMYPETRGIKYNERHNVAAEESKKIIKQVGQERFATRLFD